MPLLCRVGYIGWNFKGTSVQPEERTVEGEMERLLGGRVRFLSRTDAGVSAFNNHALCNTQENPLSVNRLDDVWVTGYTEVEGRIRVFWRWYRYYYPGEREIPEDLLKIFEGEHDFSSFSVPEGKNPVRRIIRFSSFIIPGFTVFDVVGESFLRQMVRRVVNGVVLSLEGRLDVERLLEEPRPKAVPPAPPEGLVLMDMGVNVKVPSLEDPLRTARKKLERMWTLYRIRSLVLSNRWILR